MYELIPEELKKLPNWVVWKAEVNPKAKSEHSRITKVPYNPKNGWRASSTNPETWSDFHTAEMTAESAAYAGIGFMFLNSGYFGIDIDDRPEELQDYLNGECDENNTFYKFIETMQSYAELSQSGNGIHIICKGRLPDKDFKNNKTKVEMYAEARYFCMTGNYCSSYVNIVDGSEAVKPLYEEYRTGNNQPEHTETLPLMPVSCSLSAQEIISKIRESKQGEKFSMLYDSGDISAYNNDDSSADMALCNILAFWCGGDMMKIDEIFRSSALMRPKWDKKNAGSTYGGRTMQKAIDSCHEFYQPSQATVTDTSLKIRKKSAPPARAVPAGKMYKFDDLGNSERLLDMFGYMLKFFYTEHKFLYYEKGKWYRDNFEYCQTLADCVIHRMEEEDTAGVYAENEEMQKAFKKHITKTRSQNARKNMVTGAAHFMPVLPEQLDRDRTIIGIKNGVLDLKTGTLMPHDSAYFLTKQIPFSYLADAPRPERWLKFLSEIFQNDKDLIRYVQKAAGYSLTGSMQEQNAFFLFGTGNNGKSTFLELLRHIFGDYASNIQADTIMVQQKSGNSASSDIARLQGSRLVTCSETAEGVRLNEPLIKQMTGDDVMTVRKLYCEEFEFHPEFKLWMATNHKPTIRGTDKGIWRRIHMIPFEADIPANQVDKNLKYKLAEESESILKWIVEGCLLWQKEGLQMPKKVLDAVKEYRKEMDTISGFLESCCIMQGEVKASVLYAVYAKWADENGEYCFPNSKFGLEMAKKFQRTHKKTGWYYSGISLNDDCKPLSIG